VTAGKAPLKSLFSKEQVAFYAKHAPRTSRWSPWSPWAHLFASRQAQSDELHRRIVVEMWLYPDGSRILEDLDASAPRKPFRWALSSGLPGQLRDSARGERPKTKTKARWKRRRRHCCRRRRRKEGRQEAGSACRAPQGAGGAIARSQDTGRGEAGGKPATKKADAPAPREG